MARAKDQQPKKAGGAPAKPPATPRRKATTRPKSANAASKGATSKPPKPRTKSKSKASSHPQTPQQPPTPPSQPAPTPPPSGPIRGAVLGRSRDFKGPAPDFPEITDPKKRAYLVQLSLTASFNDAAEAAGVSLKTGYNWRHDDTDTAFQDGVKLAMELACDRIEAEIRRRAIEGVEEPVYQQGGMVGTVRRFSDTLLIFLAKGAMPQKYRERFEHSGPNGGPIPVKRADLTALTEDELLQMRGLLSKATPGAGKPS